MAFFSLLQHGVAVDVIDQTKHTPLFRAAEMGHTDVLKKLVAGMNNLCVKFDRWAVDVSGACYIYDVFSTFSYECM